MGHRIYIEFLTFPVLQHLIIPFGIKITASALKVMRTQKSTRLN